MPQPVGRLLAGVATIVTVIALGEASPAPAPAQERGEAPASTVFGGSIDIELVNLEVYATGQNGEPVADLQAEDFRVFEDGRPVELSHFVLVGSPEGSGGRGKGSSAKAGWFSGVHERRRHRKLR